MVFGLSSQEALFCMVALGTFCGGRKQDFRDLGPGESGSSRRFLSYIFLLVVTENRCIFLLVDCPVFEGSLLVTVDVLLPPCSLQCQDKSQNICISE